LSDPLGPRWTDGPLLGREGEEGALALLRDAPVPVPLTDVAAQRLLRKLRAAAPERRSRWVLRPALIAGLGALALAGAAAAGALLWRQPAPPVVSGPVAEYRLARPHRADVAGQPPPVAPLAVAANGPSAVDRPARAPLHMRRHKRGPAAIRHHAHAAGGLAQNRLTSPARPSSSAAPRPARVAAAGSTTEDGSLAEETRLFRAALARLRIARDPHGALALLDGYAAAFPRGRYAAEASVARIDALLAAGRRADALAALRALSLAAVPRRLELTVMRAELAAAAGDCQGARADLDSALAERLPPTLEERALYERALCRDRAGDRAGARVDLDRLLLRFPAGNLAPSARTALESP
jgi:hypothetical protein